MAISTTLAESERSFILQYPVRVLLIAPILLLLVRLLYRISSRHPLSAVPGPLIARVTSLWLKYHAYIGDEATVVDKLHKQYGSVVRTSPESVDISDGTALQPIYVTKGGFLKPAFYENFDIDGHRSIFSETDPSSRAPRAKAVASIFSMTNLRDDSETIGDVVDEFVERLRREILQVKSAQDSIETTIDVLALCRALAIDVVTGYLFGHKYGACEEDTQVNLSQNGSGLMKDHESTMTASAMVDSFVAVGKFWYLSTQAFQMVERVQIFLWPQAQAEQSIAQVDKFVAAVVEATSDQKADTTNNSEKVNLNYPSRLLQAGFTASEVHAQCKDLIFAGTDSTGMNLATIIFHITKSPSIYAKLKTEISNNSSNLTFDSIQTLPYLRAVIREGLRLSMANPSRLPRVVPPNGFQFEGFQFPAGTVISCTPYSLHFNPDVFSDPFDFNPDRWLFSTSSSKQANEGSTQQSRMQRDFIPFGLGSRQCIARNLATVELFCAVAKLVQDGVLEYLRPVQKRIEIKEWFNSHVVGGRIDFEVLLDKVAN